MFKSEYRKQVISAIKELVFLNSYDENLVGICLYGYVDPEPINELDLICFYENYEKRTYDVFNNTFCIGDTYIKCANIDVKKYGAFIDDLYNGVIIYDPKSILSKVLNDSIIENRKYCVASNEISFDLDFTKELIDSIILDKARDKNDTEKYNSLYNIYTDVAEGKKELEEENYSLFLSAMNFYNKTFMDNEEAELHNTVLNDVLNNYKNTKTFTKKK